MDAGYVRRKEVSEGGSAGITIFANVVLVITIFKSDGCNDDANCATLVLFLMSICLYVVVTGLVALLAVREKQNENKRKKNEEIRNGIEKIQKQNKRIRKLNKKNRIQQDEIPEIVGRYGMEDLERRKKELTDREKSNDRMNDTILVLTIIGGLLNIIINAMKLR